MSISICSVYAVLKKISLIKDLYNLTVHKYYLGAEKTFEGEYDKLQTTADNVNHFYI